MRRIALLASLSMGCAPDHDPTSRPHAAQVAQADADADGHPASSDCDDHHPDVHPGADDVRADGLDQDCDGHDACWIDADGDGLGGHAARGAPLGTPCGDHPGTAAAPGDCDDHDPDVAGPITWFADADADGWGDDTAPWIDCAGAPGWVLRPGDCDDTAGHVHPDAFDVPGDGTDADCDGHERCWLDRDGDGVGDGAHLVEVAGTDCPAGTATHAGDCDDDDPTVTRRVWHPDTDADGRGDPLVSGVSCTPPPGWVADASDCDDTDAALPRTWHADADADGHGDPWHGRVACTPPPGFVGDATDCDDSDPTIRPDAPEVCNGRDDDCDGRADLDDPGLVDPITVYTDADADGWGAAGSAHLACATGATTSLRPGDCDDHDPAAFPGAPETPYDGRDQDCDGADWTDVDGDGSDGGPGGPDCDDTDPDVHPGATEVCRNGRDDDCDPTPRTCGLGGLVGAESAPVRLSCGVPGARFGHAVLGGVDLTADGRPDLIVGAPGRDLPPLAAGAGVVYVASGVHLGPGELDADADTSRLFANHQARAGTALAALDGFLWIGAPGRAVDGIDAGGVHRIAAPVPSPEAYVDTLGTRVDGAANAVGLGARLAAEPTLASGARVLVAGAADPSALVWIEPSAWRPTGWSVASSHHAGELRVGRIDAGGWVGAVASGPSPLLGGPPAWAFTRRASDGSADVVVLSDLPTTSTLDPDAPPPGLQVGRWSVPHTLDGPTLQVALPGDLTGDGVPDLVVGDPCAPRCAGPSHVWVVPGPQALFGGSLADVGTVSMGLHLVHPDDGAEFGASLASAGDVDGDGHLDLLVGAPGDDDGRGTAWLLYGPLPSGTVTTGAVGGLLPGAHLRGADPPGRFGAAVARAGDLDGDGYDDVAVGAPLDAEGGAVLVWFGDGE